ncbi:MAG: 5'-nucleotidase, lipoprotein e(P4) family [Candidatus Cloacimonadales bacterium]
MKHFRSHFFLIPLIILPIIFALGIIDQSQPGKELKTEEVKINNEALLMSVLWHQTAAEYRALCYQAYNLARLRLQEELGKKYDKKLAVIVDVDETVLDNSPYNAGNIVGKLSYPDDFYRWIESANCQPVPGAMEFLQFAAQKQVAVFYVTNRRERGEVGTLNNLQKLGFPNVRKETVLFKTDKSSKQPRREQIMADHELVLMIGDNLLDFDDFYKGEDFASRKMAVDQSQDVFGDKFIMLPNAMHGEWIKLIYNREKALEAEAKIAKRLELLDAFE